MRAGGLQQSAKHTHVNHNTNITTREQNTTTNITNETNKKLDKKKKNRREHKHTKIIIGLYKYIHYIRTYIHTGKEDNRYRYNDYFWGVI